MLFVSSHLLKMTTSVSQKLHPGAYDGMIVYIQHRVLQEQRHSKQFETYQQSHRLSRLFVIFRSMHKPLPVE